MILFLANQTISTASHSKGRMPAVMADNQNSNNIAYNAKQKMVGEASKVNSPQVSFSNRKILGARRSISHKMPQLQIELVRKFGCSHLLVIFHDPVDIRVNLRMKDELH
jgi:hypothetical protein